MTSLEIELKEFLTECWCYTAKKQVIIYAVPKGVKQAQLIMVTNCTMFDVERQQRFDCPYFTDLTCLIGKIREGVWRR